MKEQMLWGLLVLASIGSTGCMSPYHARYERPTEDYTYTVQDSVGEADSLDGTYDYGNDYYYGYNTWRSGYGLGFGYYYPSYYWPWYGFYGSLFSPWSHYYRHGYGYGHAGKTYSLRNTTRRIGSTRGMVAQRRIVSSGGRYVSTLRKETSARSRDNSQRMYQPNRQGRMSTPTYRAPRQSFSRPSSGNRSGGSLGGGSRNSGGSRGSGGRGGRH
jgi:hypothetical protein